MRNFILTLAALFVLVIVTSLVYLMYTELQYHDQLWMFWSGLVGLVLLVLVPTRYTFKVIGALCVVLLLAFISIPILSLVMRYWGLIFSAILLFAIVDLYKPSKE